MTSSLGSVPKKESRFNFAQVEGKHRLNLRNITKKSEEISPVGIIPLPAELLYNILDFLPLQDVISFTFCRWDFFLGSVDFLKSKVGHAFQDLDSLVHHFKEKDWPKQLLLNIIQSSTRSEKPILRDFNILIALFEEMKWPESVLLEIVDTCVELQLPIMHSFLRCGFKEEARIYLQQTPPAIFDTNVLQMTALHISVLSHAAECVKVTEIILREMPESIRLDYVNRRDDLKETALDHAIRISPIDVINTLILAGAELNYRDPLGYTPLMNACHFGRDEVINCLVDRGANLTATNNFEQSILEQIMMGNSHMKHDLLKRLGPYTNQAQLNRALWHAFNNKREFLGVLLECGAEAEYVGLSEGDLLGLESPQSSETLEGLYEMTAHDDLRELGTDHDHGPGIRIVERDLIESDSSIEEGNEKYDSDILLKMESLNIDARCSIGSGSLLIVRIGPIECCKYIIEKGMYRSTASFQNVSDCRNRISRIRYTDEMGLGHYRYGRDNIKGIVGVAVAERPSWNCSRRAPTAYVKIKWVDIAHVDAILCPKGCSWITRTDFIRMVGQVLGDILIQKAWDRQEERYRTYERLV